MQIRQFLSVVLTAIWLSPSSAAELVVIESNVDQFQLGDYVDGNKKLQLVADARVTLIDELGEVTTLTGPYSGRPAPARADAESGLIKAISSLLRDHNSTVITVRGLFKASADEWAPNVTRSGVYCVREDRPVVLSRGKVKTDVTLVLEITHSGEKVTVDWPAGKKTIRWPDGFPLLHGGNYFAHLSGAIGATELTLLKVPLTLVTDVHRAAWMGHNGCEKQAKKVLKTVARQSRS